MLLKGSLIVFSATLLGNFFNYLYHFVASRFLSPAQYGLLQSFVALNYFLAVLIATFSLTVINQINTVKPKQLPAAINNLHRLALKLTLISWLIFLLLYPFIKTLLHLTNPYLFIVFSLQLLFAFLPTLYFSILRAKLKFTSFSLASLASPFVKTLATFIFLFIGWQVLGAIAGLTLASLAGALLSYFLVKRLLPLKINQLKFKLNPKFWRFALLSLITTLALTSLYSSDILLVRYFLSPNQAGIYSAVSVLGKIILFVSATIYTVSFPIFNQPQPPARLKKSFQQAFLLVSAVGLTSLFIYHSFPQLIIHLLYGPTYAVAAQFLPGFALFMLIFVLFDLCLLLLLSLRQPASAYLAGLTALTQIILIIFRHPDLNSIIINSIIAVSFGLLLSSIFAIKVLNAKT
jgi:O-antigen/teichoic acid export membrane protein